MSLFMEETMVKVKEEEGVEEQQQQQQKQEQQEEGEQPPAFSLITENVYRHRKQIEVKPDDVAVCNCHPTTACHVDNCLNALLCVECTAGYCPCGEACQNQRFQRVEYAPTEVKRAEGRGWGLYAAEDIEEGAFVLEYCGEVIPQAAAHRRLEEYLKAGVRDVYMLQLNNAEVVDPTREGAPARFINHSCAPNCEIQKWTVKGEIRVGVFAKQAVAAGTELTYDYNFEWWGGEKIRCRCGADACVGYLGAKSRGFQEDTYLWEDDDGRFEVEDIPIYDSGEEQQKGISIHRRQQQRRHAKGAAEQSAVDAAEAEESSGDVLNDSLARPINVGGRKKRKAGGDTEGRVEGRGQQHSLKKERGDKRRSNLASRGRKEQVKKKVPRLEEAVEKEEMDDVEMAKRRRALLAARAHARALSAAAALKQRSKQQQMWSVSRQMKPEVVKRIFEAQKERCLEVVKCMEHAVEGERRYYELGSKEQNLAIFGQGSGFLEASIQMLESTFEFTSSFIWHALHLPHNSPGNSSVGVTS